MKVYSANEIRNIAILGHSGSGKTTLMEAALHATKVTSRMGRVEDGNTASDYDAEEIRRKSSVSASLIPIEWKNSKINFIDTPGYFDFVGAVREALYVADAALIVANAKSGIEVGTELAWEKADDNKLPRFIYITGMDDENADYFRVLDDMKSKFASSVMALQLPFKEGGKIAGYIDTLTGEAYKFDGAGSNPCEIPEDMKDVYEEHHASLLEVIAETCESLIEKYLGGETLTDEEYAKGLRDGIANGDICPVLCGVATKMIGVGALLDTIVTHLPPTAELCKEVTVTKGTESITIPCNDQGSLCAFVFKTISDPFVGRLSLFRVYSGTAKKDTPLFNSNKEAPEKSSQLIILRGKDQIDISEIRTGDIGAFAKLSDTNTQHTLAIKSNPYKMPEIEFPASLLSMAVTSKGKGEEDKVSSAFQKLLSEDRTLKFHINKETKQTVISGVGDAQLDVLVNRIKARYKLEIELNPPLIPYREKIKGKARVQGKFKKQSGGSGQFGDVWMTFEPSDDLEKAYVFEQTVVGGSVPKQYFPAVEKGIQECVKAGPVAAYPVVGLKAILEDGSYHAVDSSELAFKMAATLAFRKGFMEAKPVILEPIMKVVVTIPDDYTGAIMGDMNKRRGRVLGTETVGKKNAITAEAPHAEMQKYSTDLRSMTQGRGSFTMAFERYDEAPSDIQQKVITARKKELEALKDKE